MWMSMRGYCSTYVLQACIYAYVYLRSFHLFQNTESNHVIHLWNYLMVWSIILVNMAWSLCVVINSVETDATSQLQLSIDYQFITQPLNLNLMVPKSEPPWSVRLYFLSNVVCFRWKCWLLVSANSWMYMPHIYARNVYHIGRVFCMYMCFMAMSMLPFIYD